MKTIKLLTAFFLSSLCLNAQTGTTSLVNIGPNGKLVYIPDAKGNIVPDYSWVGYMHGETPIPTIPVVKTITAVAGDNLNNIQTAIGQAEALTPNANGFRGAVLLKAGVYNVSNTITISKSGVLLIGEGSASSGTRLIATRAAQHTFIEIRGAGGPVDVTSTRKQITNSYVPFGTRTVTVAAGHSFQAGDRIFLERKPNQAWISLLKMDVLSQSDPADSDWTPSGFTMKYKRKVVAVNGNQVTIDAPVVDLIDAQYAEGYLYKYTWNNRIEKSGIENMYLESVYASDTDENHAWDAIAFINAENCWMRNIEAHYFGYSTANVYPGSYMISVLNCKNIDPKSQNTGSRKYSFNCDGEQCLIKDCSDSDGRHGYVLGSATPGPNAFVNCSAVKQHADIGPHHRWSTGVLFDNITCTGDINVQNRLNSGSGHGWSGSQVMYWNCTGGKFIIHDPPSDHANWAIGCKGTITNVGNWTTEPLGFVESKNNFVVPPQSLYEQQLCDRLSLPGCNGIIPPPVCQDAIASADDGNIPPNVLDNNLNTRWSANGNGQWIKLCLDDSIQINRIQIAFYQGNQRSSTFDVEVSLDGITWNKVITNASSSGSTLNLEPFMLPVQWARYARITGHGNNINTWNSYTEIVLDLVVATGIPDPNVNTVSISAYPTPFNEKVNISYVLPEACNVTLVIYDMQGKEVKVVVSEQQHPGKYNYNWDVSAEKKNQIENGMYIVRFVAGDYTTNVKLMRMRE